MDLLLNSPVTLALLVLNVLISFYAFQNEKFQNSYLLWVGPMRQRNEWHRAITSGFLHGDPTHLLLNMYALYVFGPYLEQWMGAPKYLFVYFFSLLAGSAWALMDNWRNPQYRALGASGAISGVVLAFCLFQPFAMLGVMFIIPMWAIVFGIGYIIISYVLSQRANTVIGHGAHLGGALAGIVATIIVEPGIMSSFVEQVMAKFG